MCAIACYVVGGLPVFVCLLVCLCLFVCLLVCLIAGWPMNVLAGVFVCMFVCLIRSIVCPDHSCAPTGGLVQWWEPGRRGVVRATWK